MRIGIDIRFLPRDNRGMGRYVRGMLTALLSAHTDDQFVLAHDRRDTSSVAELLLSVGADERVRVIDTAAYARADVDVSWHPWNRIDTMPRAGTVAVTIHDIAPIRFAQRSIWKLLDNRHAEQRTLSAIRRADLVLSVSNASADELRGYAPALAGEITVVYPGIDQLFLSPEAGSGCSVPDDYILFVGADDERKNIGRLIEAFALLRSDVSGLVLCGVGAQARCKYEPILQAADLGQDVIFLDPVSDSELRALYAGARALVFPSLYEGFGLPILEAMACGTPVVCSNVSSMPEVAHGSALLCDPEDPIDIADKTARCLADESLRAELVSKGRARARDFSWERSGEALMHAFRRLVEA